MEFSIATVEEFKSLFTGNTAAHGVHIDNPEEVPDKNGKRRGTNYTSQESVTTEHYITHLEGTTGLGIVPVNQDGNVLFSALDVDVYETDHKLILEALYRWDFPCVPFRSKSGGLHLYTFFKTPTKASLAIDFMNDLKRMLALDKKTETFPKQSGIKDGGIGNWINIPYYNVQDTKQYVLTREGGAVDFAEAVDLCKRKCIDMKDAKAFIEGAPLSDAPPCIQSIYILGDTFARNNYLFSVAVYYKAKVGDDFEFAVVEANNALAKPIEISRLSSTVIASHKKKNYTYNCDEDPCASLCSKMECKKRKYGIGGSEISDLSYEEFTQYASEPPYYEWRIDGHSLKFYKEADIINQTMFRELCFRYLHKLPMKLSDVAWTKIINTALSNVIVKAVDKADDVSIGSVFHGYLAEFMTKRASALTKEHVAADRVYKDEHLDCYVFKPRNLLVFLIQQKQFRAYSITEIQDKLKTLGGEATKYYVSQSMGSIRVWTLPTKAIEDYVEGTLEHVTNSFMEELPNEPF